MGSSLKNDQEYVWPPTALEVIFGYKKVNDLLADDLQPIEPIEKVGPMGVYRTLIDDIRNCGYSEGSTDKRFIPFPYDWRLSNAISAKRLADLLDGSFTEVPPDLNITLLAHSMGGLVMRYLLESGHYSGRSWFSNIKRLITMGTPHYGASMALFRLQGTEKSVGLSGPDIKRLANDPRYPSTFELIPPADSALTTERPLPGNLPTGLDPFDKKIVKRLKMNKKNISQARNFWSGLNLYNRPEHVDYFFIVGSAMKTNIRNEWINPAMTLFQLNGRQQGMEQSPSPVRVSRVFLMCFPRKNIAQSSQTGIYGDTCINFWMLQLMFAPNPQAMGRK